MDDPQAIEDHFFAALRAGAADTLVELLDDEFLIVDVLNGDVANRVLLVRAIADDGFRFERIEVLERSERRFPDTAIIIGRIRTSGRFDASPFSAVSRYTHVFVRDRDRWRLASSQGASIAG